jgi:hypothetical protein
MPRATCHERDELERRINLALHQLTENTRSASNLAKQNPADPRDFSLLQNQNAVLAEQLRVLRDCLQLHKDWHGC